ncbi:hypothetical protein ADK86_24250 [Streptomyces sp. NRRL F-5755]|nr:hypothetical protein ADK86_24250 [Streptomyces sp. NRRL F-5755]
MLSWARHRIRAVGSGEVLRDPEVQGGHGRVDPVPLFVGEVGQQGTQVVEGEGEDAARGAVQEVGDGDVVCVAAKVTAA